MALAGQCDVGELVLEGEVAVFRHVVGDVVAVGHAVGEDEVVLFLQLSVLVGRCGEEVETVRGNLDDDLCRGTWCGTRRGTFRW